MIDENQPGTVSVEVIESFNVHRAFIQAVRKGLSRDQKSLPPKFFYDRKGSELFEKICDLDVYYPTNSERRILQSHSDEMIASMSDDIMLVEFGSGSSSKTRTILKSILQQQDKLQYVPIDISGDFLQDSVHQLAEEFGTPLRIDALVASYMTGMNYVPETDFPRLFLFLGGNIGNFVMEDIDSLLTRLASMMKSTDRLMIGVDLVKEPEIIEAAYNDSKGVTAEFNKNILRRINRELGGSFDLDRFEHWAPYLEEEQRVEMRLVSTMDQSVYVEDIEESFYFDEAEYVQTEVSQKFTLSSWEEVLQNAGLTLEEVRTDDRDYFAETLIKKC